VSVDFNLEPVDKKDLKQSKLGKGEDCVDFGAQGERFKALSDRLWGAADEMRANSSLKSSDYSTPVLGLIFLRYADYRFGLVEAEIGGSGGGRRRVGAADYQAKNVLFLTPEARYQHLLDLPEGADVGRSIDNAMRDIEKYNSDLRGILPTVYSGMERRVLVSLLKTFNFNLDGFEGDVFGKIYEYFLGKFAMAEGQRAGEFFTPTSIVKLIVNVIEPYRGRILDPACGSGGMFVQSAEFVKEHRKNPGTDIMIYGQEKTGSTVNLCKMNLAVHGLSGDVRDGNTYYVDHHDSVGRFDFVMANPPFNVNGVDKEAISDDPRFDLGIPNVDNANYLWIQAFYSALNESGRAGFIMANSASDARYTEQEIRFKLIKEGVVDVVISIASNFFYTVTLPVTLWFLDKGKKPENKNKVLFIDARKIFNQIDRAHREFTDQQVEFISNIVRLYRGQDSETMKCSSELMKEHFPEMKYRNIDGLCKVSLVQEIEKQGWSLNPGRYVGMDASIDYEFDFDIKFSTLVNEYNTLSTKSQKLEEIIFTIFDSIRG
jgi:type I restriction enzyme M protein